MRASRKLSDKGRDGLVHILLVGLSKAKIKVGHRSLSGHAYHGIWLRYLESFGWSKNWQTTSVTFNRSSWGSTDWGILSAWASLEYKCRHVVSDGKWEMAHVFGGSKVSKSVRLKKLLHWKNNIVVPLWWVSHAILWFVDGSDGKSRWKLSLVPYKDVASSDGY